MEPGRVRLRRRRRLGRGHPRRQRCRLAATPVPAACPGGRLGGRSVDDAARRAVGDARRDRADGDPRRWRIPTPRSRPPGRPPRPASRSRCRRCRRGRSRTSRRPRPDGDPLVPAVRPARPGVDRGRWSSGRRPPAIAAIVLTVDLPVLGYRDRDRRSGFELPSLGNFVERLPTHRPVGPTADGPAAAGPRP